MTSRTREFFDFAQLEPDSAGDMAEMFAGLSAAEKKDVEKVIGSLTNAIRNARADESFAIEVESEKI